MTTPVLLITAAIAALAAVALGVLGWRPRQDNRAATIALRVSAVVLLAVAAVITGAVLLVNAFVGGLIGATEAQEVPCQDIARFIDQPGLPSGMTDVRCTHEGLQDTIYTMEATVSRPDFSAWLAGLPGGPQLDDQGCTDGADLCTDQIEFVPRANGGADDASASATIQPDGRLRVQFTAFNV